MKPLSTADHERDTLLAIQRKVFDWLEQQDDFDGDHWNIPEFVKADEALAELDERQNVYPYVGDFDKFYIDYEYQKGWYYRRNGKDVGYWRSADETFTAAVAKFGEPL